MSDKNNFINKQNSSQKPNFRMFVHQKPDFNEKIIAAFQKEFHLNRFSPEYVFDSIFDQLEISKLSQPYFTKKFEVYSLNFLKIYKTKEFSFN